jgi:hypothetical protein
VGFRASRFGVVDQVRHKRWRDGLPPDRFAFFRQPDQALPGVEIVRGERECSADPARGFGVQPQQQRV